MKPVTKQFLRQIRRDLKTAHTLLQRYRMKEPNNTERWEYLLQAEASSWDALKALEFLRKHQ